MGPLQCIWKATQRYYQPNCYGFCFLLANTTQIFQTEGGYPSITVKNLKTREFAVISRTASMKNSADIAMHAPYEGILLIF